jgi:hypothetical protein
MIERQRRYHNRLGYASNWIEIPTGLSLRSPEQNDAAPDPNMAEWNPSV